MINAKLMRLLMLSLLIAAAFPLSFPSGNAVPTPHGISGFALELDGISQVPVPTDFSINNTATGQFIRGKTGRGSNTGKYAASLNGNDGDTILITVWNIEHSATKNVTLSGFMENVNLFLNTSLTGSTAALLTTTSPTPSLPATPALPGPVSPSGAHTIFHPLPSDNLTFLFMPDQNAVPLPVQEILLTFSSMLAPPAVTVTQPDQRPLSAPPPARRVYRYLTITTSPQAMHATITFAVPITWLEANQVEPANVGLIAHTPDGWAPLPTAIANTTDGDIIYRADAQNTSLLAIAIRDELPVSALNGQSSGTALLHPLPETYALSGIILSPDGTPVAAGTRFTLHNPSNNDTVTGVTGIGPASGAFFALVTGKRGDKLSFRIDHALLRLTLNGDMEGLAITLNQHADTAALSHASAYRSLDTALTGRAVSKQRDARSSHRFASAAAIALVSIVAATAFWLCYRSRRQLRRRAA